MIIQQSHIYSVPSPLKYLFLIVWHVTGDMVPVKADITLNHWADRTTLTFTDQSYKSAIVLFNPKQCQSNVKYNCNSFIVQNIHYHNKWIYFCLCTQTDQATPIVMKTHGVFQDVQLFLKFSKKNRPCFHGTQSYNWTGMQRGFLCKIHTSRSLVKGNIWPVGYVIIIYPLVFQ